MREERSRTSGNLNIRVKWKYSPFQFIVAFYQCSSSLDLVNIFFYIYFFANWKTLTSNVPYVRNLNTWVQCICNVPVILKTHTQLQVVTKRTCVCVSRCAETASAAPGPTCAAPSFVTAWASTTTAARRSDDLQQVLSKVFSVAHWVTSSAAHWVAHWAAHLAVRLAAHLATH